MKALEELFDYINKAYEASEEARDSMPEGQAKEEVNELRGALYELKNKLRNLPLPKE
jgi:protein subunit release factor A